VVFGPVTAATGSRSTPLAHRGGDHRQRARVRAVRRPAAPAPGWPRRAHIVNFVEIKNAVVEAGHGNHLTYVGDVPRRCQGQHRAGTITSNYDGSSRTIRHRGRAAFIGSNTALVAPVKVRRRRIVGAGSVITKDVPADALW
jgi:bifunctional UDP-N-acetylglucosamine pyrophosphorylase/glucosamine-1-phosphate N-acetyltransferase